MSRIFIVDDSKCRKIYKLFRFLNQVETVNCMLGTLLVQKAHKYKQKCKSNEKRNSDYIVIYLETIQSKVK